jgi:integrase
MLLLLTDSSIRKCLPPSPANVTKSGNAKVQEFYWDTRTEGFGVRVEKSGDRFFIVQRKLPGTGRSARITVGRYGDITLSQARDEAVKIIGKIREGVNPNAVRAAAGLASLPQTWETFTLSDAITEHVAVMQQKQDAAVSIDQLQRESKDHLSDWYDRPLMKISNADCIDRHRTLSQKIGRRGGPIIANRVFKMFRACWNSARRRHPELPTSPTFGIIFNKQRRKQSPIPWELLPAWAAAVAKIESGVRHDLQWLMLLTGTRSTSARLLRWADVDFDKGTIHFPKPKGGEDRAFTVPASAWLMAMLAKRQLANQSKFGNTPYVFPTTNRSGEVCAVQESKEYRYTNRRHKTYFFTWAAARGRVNASPHRLRDSFATACMEAGVGFTETQVLMNHTLPSGNITAGYMRPSIEHLRGCVEKVTAFLLAKAGVDAGGLAVRVGA